MQNSAIVCGRKTRFFFVCVCMRVSLFTEKLQLSIQFLSRDPILDRIFIWESQLFPSCSLLIGIPTVIKKTLLCS